MYVQSPYPGDSLVGQFPGGGPCPPSPTLGLNIDRCIIPSNDNVKLLGTYYSLLIVEKELWLSKESTCYKN